MTPETPPLLKRDDAQDFRALVCKGDVLINRIRRNMFVGDVFRESDLDAAWFWDDEEDFRLSPNLRPALEELGIPHDEEDVQHVEINQNIEFEIGGREYVSRLRTCFFGVFFFFWRSSLHLKKGEEKESAEHTSREKEAGRGDPSLLSHTPKKEHQAC